MSRAVRESMYTVDHARTVRERIDHVTSTPSKNILSQALRARKEHVTNSYKKNNHVTSNQRKYRSHNVKAVQIILRDVIL
jgi:hypothetical protein